MYAQNLSGTQLQLLHGTVTETSQKLEALGQCIPLPRHVLPVSRYRSISVSGSVIRIATKI